MSNENTSTLPAIRDNLSAIPLAPGKAVELQNIGNAFALGELVVKAGFAPKGSTVESCVVAMIEGATIGLNPLQAVQGISVVNGRPALWGDALVAVVKGSPVFGGERIEWIKGGDEDGFGCRVTVWRKGDEANPTADQFTVADAKRARLWDKEGPWKQYPRTMLRHRAVALAYRQAFADVLKGVRYAEEERDNAETPEAAPPRRTINVTPQDEETPQPRKPRADRLRAALDIPTTLPDADSDAQKAPSGRPAAEPAPMPPKDRDANPATL